MVSCAPRLPPAVSGSGVRCGRACWARVSAVPSLFVAGLSGCVFCAFFFLLGVPVPGLVVPVPPSPSFRAGLLALFFFVLCVCMFRWRGLGVEDWYGWRGEREGEVDMGRRWRAWWRPGEREWWWRGLGVVDGYGRRGERGARQGLWREGGVDVGRWWRAWRRRGERERWWRGLGVGVLYGQTGEGEVDMGRRWRSLRRPGERERRERSLWGSWWHLAERERREWVVEARWRCGEVGAVGECAVRGGNGSAAVCGTGPHRSSRASQEASAGPGRLRVVPPGTGGGGGVPCCPCIRHVGVWWRQRLVVWVE